MPFSFINYRASLCFKNEKSSQKAFLNMLLITIPAIQSKHQYTIIPEIYFRRVWLEYFYMIIYQTILSLHKIIKSILPTQTKVRRYLITCKYSAQKLRSPYISDSCRSQKGGVVLCQAEAKQKSQKKKVDGTGKMLYSHIQQLNLQVWYLKNTLFQDPTVKQQSYFHQDLW